LDRGGVRQDLLACLADPVILPGVARELLDDLVIGAARAPPAQACDFLHRDSLARFRSGRVRLAAFPWNPLERCVPVQTEVKFLGGDIAEVDDTAEVKLTA